MSGRDGFRPGTNYNRRMVAAPDPRAEIGAAMNQAAACGRGEHAEATARYSHVTYVRGRKVEPGTRYCRYCSEILPEAS